MDDVPPGAAAAAAAPREVCWTSNTTPVTAVAATRAKPTARRVRRRVDAGERSWCEEVSIGVIV